MTDDAQAQYRGRDSASLAIIGGFFVVLSLFVLGGNFVAAAQEFPAIARNVNLAAAVALFFVGVAMVVIARRINRGGGSQADSDGAGSSPPPPDGSDS